MQPGMREVWKLQSPFFREALRRHDEFATVVLEHTIEQGLGEIDREFCFDAFSTDDELVQGMVASFLKKINQPDAIDADTKAMKAELEDTRTTLEKMEDLAAQTKRMQKAMEAS
jgi:hypothetical protein